MFPADDFFIIQTLQQTPSTMYTNKTYTCDPSVNWAPGAQYKQSVLDKDTSQHEAIQTCTSMAGGRDFFVQQHRNNGHTICGVYNQPLHNLQKREAHNHTYGAVCRR